MTCEATEYKPSRQPRDHADIDSVALGDLGQPFPGSATLDGFCALIVRKLRLPTELHASSHGPFTAVAVRSRITSLSNSAIAAKRVVSSFPCELVVSHSGSPSERKAAPASLMRSMRSSNSRVERPSKIRGDELDLLSWVFGEQTSRPTMLTTLPVKGQISLAAGEQEIIGYASPDGIGGSGFVDVSAVHAPTVAFSTLDFVPETIHRVKAGWMLSGGDGKLKIVLNSGRHSRCYA